MLYVIYDIFVIAIFFFIVIPYYVYRSFVEKDFTKRFRQSMGFFHKEEIASVAGRNAIWIHGASVGEIVATSPLVKEIRKAFPNVPIIVSAVTNGGYTMAKQIIPEADAVIFFPLDLPFVTGMVVERIRPRIFMPVETELWPNFLRDISRRGIPVMMVNGRISDKSVKTYKYLYGILEDMLNCVGRFCMQSSIDADYIKQLGADPQKVVVTGNTKFDQTYAEVTQQDKEVFLRQLGIENDGPIIVAGSTHPNEEKYLLQAFIKVKEQFSNARLIIAPRKTNRINEIRSLAKSYGFETGLRSKLLKENDSDNSIYNVILIDTIGELGRIYAVGDVIYVGGSLIKHGGHNVLEPAAHSKPIIVGPNMYNFKDSYALLTNFGACVTVHNEKELASELLKILSNEELRLQMGKASHDVIQANRGAAIRSIAYLKEILAGGETRNFLRDYEINNWSTIEVKTFRKKIEFYLYQVIHGNVKDPRDMVCLSVLRLMSFLYEFGLKLKLFLYKIGIFKECKLSCVVISLGNITLGGTGKTPTARALATMIQKLGYKVVILNRGYRAHWDKPVGVVSDGETIYMTAYEAGDEAYLLAKQLPGIPVVIGKDRAISGEYVAKNMDVDVIIMDDGYQHWQLARDLDIVLIDTLNIFGNGYLLPRGTLREPLSHLNRAGMFLLTKVDQSSEYSKKYIRKILRENNNTAPIVDSIHLAQSFIEITDWDKGLVEKTKSFEQMQGSTAIAFSAIGNPASFEQTIASLGVKLVEAIRYPDHYDYGMREMQYVLERAVKHGVHAIVITEKDAVKIPREFIYMKRACPLYVLCIEVNIYDEEGEFAKTILQVLPKDKGDSHE